MKRGLQWLSPVLLALAACIVVLVLADWRAGSRLAPAATTGASKELIPLPPPELAFVPAPRYSSIFVEGPQTLRELQSEYGPEGFSNILKLNRKDIANVRQGETLVLPSRADDLLALSPFSRVLPAAVPFPKLLLVSRRSQAFGAYESGELVRWGPASTGKKSTPTPAGLFHTNWRSKERTSTVNGEWLLRWYFNLENFRGISFHEYDLPGYPASQACVRLLREDAEWIYYWAEEWVLTQDEQQILAYGTPTVVLGDYDFGAEPPWTRLEQDPEAATIPAVELEEQLRPYMSIMLSRARAREAFLAARRGP